jgi:hypothetical protein
VTTWIPTLQAGGDEAGERYGAGQVKDADSIGPGEAAPMCWGRAVCHGGARSDVLDVAVGTTGQSRTSLVL